MDVSKIRGIGPKKKRLLEKIGIHDTRDLLMYLPHSYQDRSHTTKIADAVPGGEYLMDVTVLRIRGWHRQPGGSKMTEITVTDGTESMKLIFFVSSYFLHTIQVGHCYKVYGKVELNGTVLQMSHPEISAGDTSDPAGILPVYQTVRGISQHQMRDLVHRALSELDDGEEFIPPQILEKRKVAGRSFALENIHFPAGRRAWAAAKYRLVYEEFLIFQTGLYLLRGNRGRGNERLRGIAFPHDDHVREFAASLPYQLTDAQMRVIDEIENDMESDRQMERLLQGDVGSGKTAVAAAVLYKAVKDGCQGALMAPTELLAEQHYEKFIQLFQPFGVRVGCLKGSQKKKEKDAVKGLIAAGEIDIIIGTHALIQQDVLFSNLGLVVTDEQHRFGVNQRVSFSSKGTSPDILVMTATPIPRSLAVVLFGEQDISVIDELPPGRRPIKTRLVRQKSRRKLYRRIAEKVRQGHQAYVVAPLIADSEAVDLRSAEGVYEELTDLYRKEGISVGLVHGAMNPADKEYEMRRFVSGEVQVLAATVVIEVGIDVPAATIMVIENAERFGLAQLHQLRGRVGRGSEQSYCFLVTDAENGPGRERIDVLTQTCDGFAAAERDLQMRGPGEFFGTRQHGLPEFRFADPVKNIDLLAAASADLSEILKADPDMSLPENRPLKEAALERYGDSLLTNLGI